jgi:hypothetical protein
MLLHEVRFKPERIETRNVPSRRMRFSLRALLIFVGTACVLAASLAWINRGLHEFEEVVILGATGVVESEDALPDALKPLIHGEIALKLDGKSLAVHCLQSGWDAEYICRIEGDEKVRERVIKHFGLSSVTVPPIWSLFVKQRQQRLTASQTPPWPIPIVTNLDAYSASDGYMNREPNDRYEMLHHPGTDVFYLHHYFDF